MSIKDLIEELKREKGFERLFSLFHEKYRSYERLEKNITAELTHPTSEEKEALSGLMGKDYSRRRTIKISIQQLEKALKETKYGTLLENTTMTELLESYMGRKLRSKKEEEEHFLEERNCFFDYYKKSYPNKLFLQLLEWIELEGNKQNRYYSMYKQDKDALRIHLHEIAKLLENFPLKDPMLLPIFAAKITKNPHAFDIDEELGKLLLYTLQVLNNIKTGEKIKTTLNAEEITELLLEYNIMRDDLSNYVTVYGIRGVNLNGRENRLLKGSCEEKSAINLPLKEVVKLEEVYAKQNRIFMIENSGVSSYLMNYFSEIGEEISIISGNGMVKLATLKLLDIFTAQGGKIYYAGDFDPEGLLIAQSLMERYKDSLVLLGMDKKTYYDAMSDKVISSVSLSKLENQIYKKELSDLKHVMKKEKRAGYQENILDMILTKMVLLNEKNKQYM